MKETPSQTAGPYIHIGCMPSVAGLARHGTELRAKGAPTGDQVTLDVKIFDGAGDAVKDALVEIWHEGVWQRAATDLQTGAVQFDMVKPGARAGAPHLLLWIVARGINLGLTTRVYFDDEENETDPVFQLAGARANTLVAKRTATGYAHEIYLQGEKETVFFDV